MFKQLMVAGVALAFALLEPQAAAQIAQIQPRQVVEHVAALVAENYFDEARAQTIAGELRARAASGAYDRFTNPLDLAAAITAQLHPYDGHFSVQFNPALAQAGPSGPQPGPGPGPAPNGGTNPEARSNYGFQRLELFPGGVGYIDLRSFADFSEEDAATSPARRAADAAMTMMTGADAIIIDLRESNGGSPAMVGYLASYFVPQGADIYNTFRSRGPDAYERPFVEPAGARRLTTPLFILTSGRTASASESFAYTLQAAGRATIVGAASAGGANPGGMLPAGDGFAVFVSAATPVNPITHHNWEGAGVQPNVVTTSDDALTTARGLALEAVLHGNPPQDEARTAQFALDLMHANYAVPARDLRAYVGNYGVRTVAIENGRLVVHRDRRPALILRGFARDTFVVENSLPLQRITFERDAHGRITALAVEPANGPPSRNLREG